MSERSPRRKPRRRRPRSRTRRRIARAPRPPARRRSTPSGTAGGNRPLRARTKARGDVRPLRRDFRHGGGDATAAPGARRARRSRAPAPEVIREDGFDRKREPLGPRRGPSSGSLALDEAGRRRSASSRGPRGSEVAGAFEALRNSLEEKTVEGRREAEDIRGQIAPLLESHSDPRAAEEKMREEFGRLRESLADSLAEIAESLRQAVKGVLTLTNLASARPRGSPGTSRRRASRRGP